MSRALRVWLEGAALTGRVTGIQRMTESLFAAATKRAADLDVRAFRFLDSAPARPTLALPWRTVPATRLGLFQAARVHLAPPLELLLRTRPAIFFFPEFVTFPVSRLSKVAVIVPDLAHLAVPEFVASGPAWLLRHGVPRSVARADVVITISEAIGADIARQWPRHAHKVKVVTCGVDDRFRGVTRHDVERMRAALAVPPTYLLFAATLEPRKNLGAALDAYARLPAHTRARVPLLVAGGRGWNDDALKARLDLAVREQGVRALGYVADEHLPALYAGARALIFPSHYEGFGLPVLEAMAAGCPVIASTAAAVKEVAGDAALLVGARDVDGLAAAMARVIDDDALRERLALAGPARARAFTWDASADRLLEIVRALR